MSRIRLKNLREIFDILLPKTPDRIAYKIRKGDSVRDISCKEFVSDVRDLAAFIYSKDIKVCAVIGENSYKQQIAYYATTYAGAIVVPIDKELTVREIATIINMSKSTILFCGDTHEDMVDEIKSLCNNIDTHIFLSDKSEKVVEGNMEHLMVLGNELIAKNNQIFDYIKINPDEPSTYVFTSGTTGVSKGVMLSHKNIITDVDAAIDLKVVGDSSMAILPMHHTLQSTLCCTLSHVLGATVSVNNSIKLFAQNLKIFKPTDLVCVPMVLESMHTNVWNAVRESGKEKSFKFLIKVSNFLRHIGIDMRKVFFKKIHENFGGRLKTFFCGGALLDPLVAQDMCDWGFGMYIGYGITECSPLITHNTTNRRSKFSSCGIPINCNKLKLMDINESGDGEIWVKGDNVMLGYLDNPEATAEVLEDGWYKTGDIGRFDKDKFLYITGRKKNIIVLNNGKNIYPEELEGHLNKYPEVKEVIVFAEKNDVGQEVSISAEIFADYEYAELMKIEDIKKTIEEIVEKENQDLAYYKRITNVIHKETEFEKTTTRKIKRHKL